jgi:hypothetical protein
MFTTRYRTRKEDLKDLAFLLIQTGAMCTFAFGLYIMTILGVWLYTLVA